MTGDRAHGGEHARIFHPAAFKLLEHYPLTSIFGVNRHCRRHCIDTPAAG